MSGMLNTLLDINQIEAGTVHAEMVSFPIGDLLDRLRDEFAYHARAKGAALRMVPCSLSICSDPRLLEQMIRNLLANAMKYTEHGKVLLGCRRHRGMVSIEVWDTGIGIPEAELDAIFEEYRQLDDSARERSRGLGLGLSIVRHLGNLLGHRIQVRSRLGKGSVFAIEVMLPKSEPGPQPEPDRHVAIDPIAAAAHRTGAILVIEDDPEVCDLLELVLKADGHDAVTAHDGAAALELVARGKVQPNLYRRGLQPAGRHERSPDREKTAGNAATPNSVHHSDRRHFDRDVARYCGPGLYAAQQTGEAEGTEPSHPASAPDVLASGARAH
jgi:two-component system CheB/CheR fusion protein